MTDQLQDFKNWLLINGLSENTACNYCYRLGIFLSIHQLTEQSINNFILDLIKKSAKKDTINGYILAIRKFLVFKGLQIKTPKIHQREEKIPKSFTYEYFKDEIIPAVEVAGFKNTIQVKAVFNFLFFIPLRKGELYNLKRENIDLEKREVKINHQKTKKEKKFPIPNDKSLFNLVKLYFSIEREKKNAFNIGRGTLEHWCRVIDGYLKEIHLHPHLFVHSSISYWASRGMNILFLSRFTGRSIETLQKYYVNTQTEEIRKVCDEIVKKEKRRKK